MNPSVIKASHDGVKITRGVTLRIPVGGMVIHENAQGSNLEILAIELQLDTCIYWLEIALEHLSIAKMHHEALVCAHASGSDTGDHLHGEFKAGIQAAFASATFFEALYAAIGEIIKTKNNTKQCGRKKISRARIVAERLRQAFGLRKIGTANLQSVLAEIYKFRDAAVHPSAIFSTPALHPVLNVLIEKRFVMFSFESARTLVRGTLAFAKILPSRDLSKRPKKIQEFGENLLTMCEPHFKLWEQTYGQLLDVPNAT